MALDEGLSGTEPILGRLFVPSLKDPSAAFVVRRLRFTEPSATPFSTAAPIAAVLAPGAKDELLRRLMRLLVPKVPCETVWECVLLTE